MRFVLAFLIIFAGVQAAFAAADPCAKYSDADAYNNCLAGSGPVAKSHKLGPAPPPGAARPARAKRQARGARRSVATSRATQERAGHRRNGRVRVEILR